MAYTELPTISTSTPAERLQALQDAKDLMSSSGTQGGLTEVFFGKTRSAPGASTEVIDGFLRLAEYITTGHDYQDTHPVGKRRPIIKQTHVTVMAAGAPSQEDIEHLLEHLKAGDFLEFMEKQMDDTEQDGPAEGDTNK